MKIGIVGAGYIVNEFMIGAKLVDELEVVALYSRTFEKAEEFCKKHNIGKLYKSSEELLSSDIDSVYVASQNDTHFEYSIKALS